MLDDLIGGFGHGYGHNDHKISGFGFQEHKEFVSHEESERGYFDRQARYDHHMRIPANHGRPPMAHMPVCDEEDSDSDVEELYESRQSHHTTMLPNHNNNYPRQPPHMNFMPPPPVAQPHHKVHNGKMGNGWQGRHEDAYHGGHGMEHHGGHGMEHHGGNGMKHHGGHEMEHHGGHGMKHQDRLMAPQVPPHHVYMNPIHGNGGGRAVVVKASENWRMSNKVGWRAKGL